MNFRILSDPKAREFMRFILSGASNTLITYLIYLLLFKWIGYRFSYLAAYVAGIIFSYFINTLFVFKAKPTKSTFLMYPLIYVVQYFFCAGILELSVKWLHIDEHFAPLVVVAMSVPLTFVLSRLVIVSGRKPLPEN